MTRTPVRPNETDKDPIWGIYKSYPIIGANNDGTLYHYQWQKIIDALNLLLAHTTSGGGLPNNSQLSVKVVEESYNMAKEDAVLLVKHSTPITITLPTNLTSVDAGRIYYIKDSLGLSENHPITIIAQTSYIDSPPSSLNPNPDTTDGTFIIDENYAAINFVWVGTYWHIL
jgi:hypothetical protein